MCTRFRGVKDLSRLAERYGITARPNYEYNPNVAPTELVPIIRSSHSEGKKLQMARFGLIPNWAKDKKIGVRFLNARLETADTLPAYKQAWLKRRCIIAAEGYYEWREENGKKQPYLFARADGELMALAGLWDYAEIDKEPIFSFTLITNEPNPLAATIHDRMPVILQDDAAENWLDPVRSGKADLSPFLAEDMVIRKMNPVMNKPTVKDLSQIEDDTNA